MCMCSVGDHVRNAEILSEKEGKELFFTWQNTDIYYHSSHKEYICVSRGRLGLYSILDGNYT